MSRYNTLTDQPMPEPIADNGFSIHDLCLEKLHTQQAKDIMMARKQFGYDKYGTYLTVNNGRPVIDDLIMEVADALAYAKQGYMRGHDLDGIVNVLAIALDYLANLK